MSEDKMNEAQTQEQTNLTQESQALQVSATPENEVPVQSPGALLAARREELGLSLERVAEQLKMTTRRILEIEADNTTVVDSKAVYRGFVRAYAKVLRMDPEPLVAMIADKAAKKVSLTPARNRTLDSFSETHIPFIAKYSMQSRRMGIAIIVVALLICALLAQRVGWIPSLPQVTSTRAESAPASAPVVAAPAEAEQTKSAASAPAPAEAATAEKTKQIDLPPVDVSSQVAPVPSKAVAEPASAAQPAPKPAAAVVEKSVSAVQLAPVPNGKNTLVLKCREESWVELKRANGTMVASRYIPAGTTARFTVNEPMQLTIGNAPAVDASLRGVRLKIYSAGDSKVVRLNVK